MMPVADANLDRLIQKHQNIIDGYVARIESRIGYSRQTHYLPKDCFGDIMKAEGLNHLAPSWGSRNWESQIPDKYKPLEAHIKQVIGTAEKNLSDRRKKIEEEALTSILARQTELVNRFCEVAERKVSAIDAYGDEQWDLLKPEITRCIKKLQERDTVPFDVPFDISWRLEKALDDIFREYHKNAKPLKDLNSMDGIEFETYVARLLRERGYSVQGTAATGDQGGDLIAQKNGKKIIVQAKRYAGTVGNKAVQEVIAALSFYQADEGWVVTNSKFTLSAMQLAAKANIKLIDGASLERELGSLDKFKA